MKMGNDDVIYTGYETKIKAQPTRPSVMSMSIPTALCNLFDIDNGTYPLQVEITDDYIKLTRVEKTKQISNRFIKSKVSCALCGNSETIPFMGSYIKKKCIKELKKGVG